MSEEPRSYWLTRFVILRLLGLVYFVAFLSLAWQGLPLVGSHGLLPAASFLDGIRAQAGSRLAGFAENPSVFWLNDSDAALVAGAWVGTALSLVVLSGFANSILMAILWALYMSFVHVGQEWYGFGWEIQLLETGFLAIFLCPLLDARPFPRRPPSPVVLGLFRWLIFRIMLGAGLIKLRGDPCWRDLTCLDFHYETQPIPNPLSRSLHFMPHWSKAGGVLLNHLCELVAPWFAFWPRRGRLAAGVLFVAFQVALILSGNLSFLNWLTIVPALACFDDGFLRRVLPGALGSRADRAAAAATPPSRAQRVVVASLAGLVAVLSYAPVRNLLSPRQAMNTSFDRLELVNTYGAFGSVGRERPEIVLEGTADAVDTPDTVWRAYEFKCKPGDPMRSPCFVSPYHERLDWLMWFAAMSTPERYPWSVHLVWKLLHNDALALSLLANDPFPASPPKRIRGLLYHYEFAPPGDPEGRWWKRTLIGTWLPPLSADDARLLRFLDAHGWP
ncbi:MAG: lipase maturation factor family protein [Acidobacteria bacterium]|nr:lipase maturation factor family protein [Acidobacteriota bacterium]